MITENQSKALSRRTFFQHVFAGLTAYELYASRKLFGDDNKDSQKLDSFDELLAQTESYGNDLKIVLENVYNPHTHESLPQRVWDRVDGIFSGPLESLRPWNRELVQNDQYAHIASYLIQDFRNSEVAAKLSAMYRNLSEEQKEEVRKRLGETVSDYARYNVLFKLGMKPFVFDPREDSRNRVAEERLTWNDNEPYLRVYNEWGNVVLEGTNLSEATYTTWHSAHTYDAVGIRRIASVQYFKHHQLLAFIFYQYKSNTVAFFRNYLRGPHEQGIASSLYYAILNLRDGRHSWAKVTPLTQEQVDALRIFYRVSTTD